MGNRKKVFIAYLNDNNETTNGYFEIVEITDSFVKFDTGINIITIPLSRVLKIKEEKE
jgi:hypothetical protein